MIFYLKVFISSSDPPSPPFSSKGARNTDQEYPMTVSKRNACVQAHPEEDWVEGISQCSWSQNCAEVRII
jgi:hypothetical protein